MKSFGAATVLIASLLCACTRHPSPSGFINALLDPHCLTAPVLMESCDAKADPLKCKKVKLTFIRGCEQLQVKREPAKQNKVGRD